VEGFYLLQALSRLRLKHPNTPALLERMQLAWRVLPAKQFVKAANAAAKLDLAGGLWARPLKAALVAAIPKLPGRQLAALKSIAVMELLDQPDYLTCYLEHAERHRASFWYSRHLQVIELHVHLLYPELWNNLDEHIRLFLQEVRVAAEQSQSQSAKKVSAVQHDDAGSESDSDDEASNRRRKYDPKIFSSELHLDVSRVLEAGVGIEHNNRLAAGPLTLDICHVPTMTAIESAAPWQYYLRSPNVTAMARRRQEMLRAMGFKLVNVPYHRWSSLQDDSAKTDYLRSLLSSDVLAHSKTARLAA